MEVHKRAPSAPHHVRQQMREVVWRSSDQRSRNITERKKKTLEDEKIKKKTTDRQAVTEERNYIPIQSCVYNVPEKKTEIIKIIHFIFLWINQIMVFKSII